MKNVAYENEIHESELIKLMKKSLSAVILNKFVELIWKIVKNKLV